MYRDNRTGDYPLYRYQVIDRRPNMSLPATEWDDSILALIDVSHVVARECPSFDPDTQRCVEQYPILVDGVWKQNWKVEPL
jgi:hypothetical protein